MVRVLVTISTFVFLAYPREPLLNALSAHGVFVSGGSACSAGRFSAVLQAIGRKPSDGAYLRLTVGRFTTELAIQAAVVHIASVVDELSAVYAA